MKIVYHYRCASRRIPQDMAPSCTVANQINCLCSSTRITAEYEPVDRCLPGAVQTREGMIV